jgi:hypothetical protein
MSALIIFYTAKIIIIIERRGFISYRRLGREGSIKYDLQFPLKRGLFFPSTVVKNNARGAKEDWS